MPSLHSLPDDARTAEELHHPTPISSQTWGGAEVHAGKLGAVGHIGLPCRSRVRGLGSRKARGDGQKSAYSSFSIHQGTDPCLEQPLLTSPAPAAPFHSPYNFSGPSLNPSKSLQDTAELWPQEKAIPIFSWPCAFTNNPSPNPNTPLLFTGTEGVCRHPVGHEELKAHSLRVERQLGPSAP